MSIEITGRITSHEILNRVLLNMNDLYKKVRFIRCPTFLGYIAELSLTRIHEGMSGVIYVTDGDMYRYLPEKYGDDLYDKDKFGQRLTADVSDYLDSAGHGKLSDFLPNCLPYYKKTTPDVYAYGSSGLIMPFDMNNYVVGSDGEKAVLIHCLILEYFRKEMDNPTVEVKPFIGGIDSWVEDKINLFASLKHTPAFQNVWLHSLIEPSLTTTGELVWHVGGTTIYETEKPHLIIDEDDAVVKLYKEDFIASGKSEEEYWYLTIRRIDNSLSDAPYNRYDPKGMYDKVNILDPKSPMIRQRYNKFGIYCELPMPASLVPTQLELRDWLKRIAVVHALYNNPPKIK